MAYVYDVLMTNGVGHDTFAYKAAPTTVYGAAEVMQVVDIDLAGGSISFLKWNLSTIPKTAIVSSAVMHLYTSYNDQSPAITVQRCSADWDEATLTWNNIPSGDGTLYTGAIVGTYAQISLNVAQFTLLITGNNYGWRMWTYASAATYYYTSEHWSQAYPYCPRLVVTYTAVLGNQVIWMFSKLLDDLRRGLVPPQELRPAWRSAARRRYQQAWAI